MKGQQPFVTTIQEPVRRAHCTYCYGKGADMQAEWIESPIGTRYRIPLSHTACKQSVLSLSLSLSLGDPAVARTSKRPKRSKP